MIAFVGLCVIVGFLAVAVFALARENDSKEDRIRALEEWRKGTRIKVTDLDGRVIIDMRGETLEAMSRALGGDS